MLTDVMIAQAALEFEEALLNSLPNESDCRHKFSVSFEKKMRKIIRRANHPVVYKVLKHAACFAVALLLAFSMLLTFNAEARASVVNWIEERFGEFYHYFFTGDEPDVGPSDVAGTDGTTGTVAPTEPKDYALGWVPEGYTLLNSFAMENGKTFIYLSSSGQMMQFVYVYDDDSYSIFTGVGEYEEKNVSLENFQAKVLSSLDPSEASGIVWGGTSGDVIFCVTGLLSESELILIAQNLTFATNN